MVLYNRTHDESPRIYSSVSELPPMGFAPGMIGSIFPLPDWIVAINARRITRAGNHFAVINAILFPRHIKANGANLGKVRNFGTNGVGMNVGTCPIRHEPI